ncbi:hypothetical protein EI94DRAFT_1553309, partial [Lactarius quietus]
LLKDRETRLRFDDHESGPISIDNGIGHSDPLSMVLYQYYNTAAYVDDAILVTTAKTFKDMHKILKSLMTR